MYYFPIIKVIFKQSFTQKRCIFAILFLKSIFFMPPLQRVLRLIFAFFPCYIKFFCILYKWSIASLWSFVINKRLITLETAKDLKTVIPPSKVNCVILHNSNMFFIFYSRFLLYEKYIPIIVLVSLLRLTHFMLLEPYWEYQYL